MMCQQAKPTPRGNTVGKISSFEVKQRQRWAFGTSSRVAGGRRTYYQTQLRGSQYGILFANRVRNAPPLRYITVPLWRRVPVHST